MNRLTVTAIVTTIGVSSGIYFREKNWNKRIDECKENANKELETKEKNLSLQFNNEKDILISEIQKYENKLLLTNNQLDKTLKIIHDTEGGIQIPDEQKHILKYGLPSTENIKFHKGYVSAYDRRNRTALWSCEHLSFESATEVDRSHSKFLEDESVPEIYRAKLEDYYKSGFDRGHLVPAGNVKFSQEAMNETFLLSNISPQVGNGFNRHYWGRLEQFARSLLSHYNDVYICTGPLYLPEKNDETGKWYVNYQVIGNPPNVSVPTHFFKTILVSNPKNGTTESEIPGVDDPSTVRIACFILPNKSIRPNTPLTDFLVPLDLLNHYSGLSLWNKAEYPLPLCVEGNCTLPPSDFWKVTSHPNYPIKETIETFLESNESSFTFPETLSSIQRKEIHSTAEKFNLEHISKPIGSKRAVVISKKPLNTETLSHEKE